MIHCIAAYHNPCGFKSRLDNFKRFYTSLSLQTTDIRIVELATEKAKLVLHNIVPKSQLIQLVDSTIIWQKEALLNIAIASLPYDWNKVCWVDADILWQDNDWIDRADYALGIAHVIQPFSYCLMLPKNYYIGNLKHEKVENWTTKYENGNRVYGALSGIINMDDYTGMTGFAWGCTYKALENQELYDRHILGASDTLISYATVEDFDLSTLYNVYPAPFVDDYLKWALFWRFKVQNNFGVVNTVIGHMYHGSIANRQYDSARSKFLRDNSFNPDEDIFKDNNSLLQFSMKGERLRSGVAKFFEDRKEDE